MTEKKRFFSERSLKWILGGALVAWTAYVFWPILRNGFVDLDDFEQITGNPYIRAGWTWPALRWALTTYYSGLWNPLVWISFMGEYQVYGLQPWGYHWTSLWLHAGSALCLFLVLRRATGASTASVLAAFLFAVHPLRVESVAFAAERKDVLSGLLWMAALGSYVRYCEKPSWRAYAAVFVFYLLDLMAKPIAVTFPLILLIFDFWPLARLNRGSWRRLLMEKSPLILLSFGASVLTMHAQRPFLVSHMDLPLAWRIGSAGVFYWKYLAKIFWPFDLALFYRHPGPALSIASMGTAILCLSAVTLGFYWKRQRHPYLLAGWAWFVIGLVPVIGLVQVTGRAIADRFTYLPQIGICILLAWGVEEIARKTDRKRECRAAMLLALLLLSWRTRDQLRYWSDPLLLYGHTLAISPDNELIHNILGVELARRGRLEESRSHFLESIRLSPGYADAHNNLGLLLLLRKENGPARAEFETALQYDPRHVQARLNLDKLRAIPGSGPKDKPKNSSR